ncbi:MAG: TVP38/TMEM64 family protein, partial [Gammaproteobacteria bacterium]|nr:TVP38/TMEM64 family protein [Gammaproteobacteria bacterium]
MKFRKSLVLIVVALLIVAFFLLDVGSLLTLENLKAQQAGLDEWRQANPWQSALVFFLVYVLVTALSLPGAAIMTLAVGAIFGLMVGTILVSFASTIGATLAFLIARFLLRDMVQAKFGDKLGAINRGIEKDGAFYLFGLRLVPLFPFFVINLAMGLTN